MVSCNGVEALALPLKLRLLLLLVLESFSTSESSSCTLISSSDSSLLCVGDGETVYDLLLCANDAVAARKAAAVDGTNDRNALCSPPINNGVDAVTKEIV